MATTDPQPTLLSRYLIRQRRRQKWSQPKLAHLVGVSKGTISAWERGAVTPDIATLHKLAAFFDEDPGHLVRLAQTSTEAEHPDRVREEQAQYLIRRLLSLPGQWFDVASDAMGDLLDVFRASADKENALAEGREPYVTNPDADEDPDIIALRGNVERSDAAVRQLGLDVDAHVGPPGHSPTDAGTEDDTHNPHRNRRVGP